MNKVVSFAEIEQARRLERGVDDDALDILFRDARTHNEWLDRPVPRERLEQAVQLAKMGPTAANSSPMRILFVESDAAKERLKPALAPGNVDKTMSAPVSAIMAYDLEFFEHLPKLFPHTDARAWFVDNDTLVNHTAMQSGTLQAAYFLLALRAVGLDAGPLNGFDQEKVDAEFFGGTPLRSNFIINIGYGDDTKLFPRSPRLAFEEIARFA